MKGQVAAVNWNPEREAEERAMEESRLDRGHGDGGDWGWRHERARGMTPDDDGRKWLMTPGKTLRLALMRPEQRLHHRLCIGCGDDTGKHSMPRGCEEDSCNCRLFVLAEVMAWLEKNTRWIKYDGKLGMLDELRFKANHGAMLLMLSPSQGSEVDARVFYPHEFDFAAYIRLVNGDTLNSEDEEKGEHEETTVEGYRTAFDRYMDR